MRLNFDQYFPENSFILFKFHRTSDVNSWDSVVLQDLDTKSKGEKKSMQKELDLGKNTVPACLKTFLSSADLALVSNTLGANEMPGAVISNQVSLRDRITSQGRTVTGLKTYSFETLDP